MDNTGGVANSIFGIGDYDTSTDFVYVKSNGLLSFRLAVMKIIPILSLIHRLGILSISKK